MVGGGDERNGQRAGDKIRKRGGMRKQTDQERERGTGGWGKGGTPRKEREK